MSRTRWIAIGTVAVMAAAACGAYALAGSRGASQTASPSSTERPSTTETTATSTTEPPTTTVPPSSSSTNPPPAGLQRGAKGPEVEQLQRRLTELGFDPGPADGSFGTGTLYAVWAFEKVHGFAPDGIVSPEEQAALAKPLPVGGLVPNGGADRVEIDLRTQLLYLYKGGSLRLVSHVSTGNRQRYCEDGYCGTAITPAGSFRFLWRVNGWRTSHLGELYNPVYFTWSGIAVHGSNSVPLYPASHGCVRIPMHIAEYFPSLVRKGDPVYVLDGITSVGPEEIREETTTTTQPPPSSSSSTTSSSSSSTSSTSSSSSSTSSTSTSSSTTSTTTTSTTLPGP